MPRSGLSLVVLGLDPDPASMRPGQSCPGVAGIWADSTTPGPRFNEAGAIMPRSGAFAGRDDCELPTLLQ